VFADPKKVTGETLSFSTNCKTLLWKRTTIKLVAADQIPEIRKGLSETPVRQGHHRTEKKISQGSALFVYLTH